MYSNSRETYKKSDLHKNLTNFVDWITKRHQECGGITEIRILKDNRAYSGYYDYENREKLIEAVLPSANPRKKIPFGDYPRIGEGNIYFTLNAVDKDLLARSAYEIKNVSATSDSDIVAYQLFAIDVDPVRKSGISSTDEEKKHALEVIDSVQQWLKEKGINSLLADSGNGYHLLVPTIQYKEEKVFEASKKAHLLLKRLDVLFSTDKAKIDTNIYNPSRIFKLYGTLAMKGSNTQERPYRWSQIDMSALPEDIDIFEILKEEIDTSSLSESKSETRIVVDSEGWSSSDSISILEGVLSAEGIPYKRKKKETRELFVFEKCPHHKEDDGHEYECCIIVEANGKYGASCKHDSIAGWQEFKSVIGWYKHIDDVKKKLELTDDEQFKSKQQAQELIDLVKGSEFFYNSRKEPFITTKVNDHFENLNLRKEDFKTFLKGLFWKKNKKAANGPALKDALGVLESKALFDGDKKEVHVRLAYFNEAVYFDLCNENWEVVVITSKGWEIVTNPPVKFIRSNNMISLPKPVKNDDISPLRELLNLSDDNDWILLLSWIISTLYPKGPYPILIVNGEQGSAKSSLCSFVKNIIDPNESSLRAMPQEIRDLIIAANNCWVLVFDNLSDITPTFSDAFCRISTGGGFAKRRLYTDEDENVIDVTRPVILNGITELSERPDLLDRAINLTLPAISPDKRKNKEELNREFKRLLPKILGALFNALSGTLEKLPKVKPTELPRMADFATLSVAAEESLGFESGSFLKAYKANMDSLNDLAIESSPLALTIQSMIIIEREFEGTAYQLLQRIQTHTSINCQEHLFGSLPKTPQKLGKELRRIKPILNNVGLYPYPLSRQKTGCFKVDSSPLVRAVGTEGARRATGVPTATPYTSAGLR